MKKVTGFISVDALGQYDFEFLFLMIPQMKKFKKKKMVDDTMELSWDY